jgi:hypothetical protein
MELMKSDSSWKSEELINNTYGLLYGKMGKCITHYCLSKEKDQFHEKEYAEELLDTIAEHISEIDNFDYANGLAGIGYGIEWLAQNNYIEVNTDEVLEDIDDEIYRLVVYSRSQVHSLEEGTLGKALYFYKRLMSKNVDQDRYKRICIKECLVLLSDELSEYFLNEETGVLLKDISLITEDELQIISQGLIFFEKLSTERINAEAVNQVICGIADFTMKVVKNEMDTDPEERHLRLIYSLAVAGLKLKDSEWQKEARRWYMKYINHVSPGSTDPVIVLMNEKLSSAFNIMYTPGELGYGAGILSGLFRIKAERNWGEILLLD